MRSFSPICRYVLTLLLLALSVTLAQESGGIGELPGETFSSETMRVNGVDMHYVIGGEGDPVVLVHGWPQTWREWEEVMPQLAEDYTVIVPDLRGAGESSIEESGYDKRTLAADIHELVLALDLAPVHIVGHDIGGMVGYAFASDYPESTHTFTLVDVPLPGIEPFWTQIRLLAWHFGFFQQPEFPERLIEGQQDYFLREFLREQAAQPDALPESIFENTLAAYSDMERFSATLGYYRAFPQDAEDNQRFAETPLEMPMLAVGGETSAGPIIEGLANAVANNPQVEVVAGVGHWVPEVQPEALLEVLVPFLEANGSELSSASR